MLNLVTFDSVYSGKLRQEEVSKEDFIERLSNCIKTSETMEEYKNMTKEERGHAKDVGGYIPALFKKDSDGNIRAQKSLVITKSIIVLDLDDVKDDYNTFVKSLKEILPNTELVIHETHSSTYEKLRLRVVIFISRDVTPEEYEDIVELLSDRIGMYDETTPQVDPCSKEAARKMFYPSAPKDKMYMFLHLDGAPLDVDEILRVTEERKEKERKEQEERTKRTPDNQSFFDKKEPKVSLIDLFNDRHNIRDLVENRPDIYKQGSRADRFTYVPGSASDGLWITKDNHAFSHDSTDPCNTGYALNCFDFYRITEYGHLDGGGVYPNPADAPSFKEVIKEIVNDPSYGLEDFSKKPKKNEEKSGSDWESMLQMTEKGKVEDIPYNYYIALKYDPDFYGGPRYDFFKEEYMVNFDINGNYVEEPQLLTDGHISFIFKKISNNYRIKTKMLYVTEAISSVGNENNMDIACEYFDSLTWDGKPRLDEILIKCLGVEDSDYSRLLTKKQFVAVVARQYEPGKKKDEALILSGKQGIGKSSFLSLMCPKEDWFCDRMDNLENKDAVMNIDGKIIGEFAELSSLSKAAIESVRAFLSAQKDTIRKPYARKSKDYERRIVFFGTTNDTEVLNDPAGNRRFWVLECGDCGMTFEERDNWIKENRDQIWAEAVYYYKHDYSIYLTAEEKKLVNERNEKFVYIDERIGIIQKFMDMEFPDDWYKWDTYQQREYFNASSGWSGMKKSEFCVSEIAEIALGCDVSRMKRSDFRTIATLMRQAGLEIINKQKTFGKYGKQKYYIRKN
jgi:predicted P-loop ATPase